MSYAGLALIIFVVTRAWAIAPVAAPWALAGFLALCLMRAFFALRLEAGAGAWQRMALAHDALVAAMAASWASASAMLVAHFGYGPETVLLYCTVAGLIAAGSTALSIRVRTHHTFLVAAFVPTMAMAWQLPDPWGFALGTGLFFAYVLKDGQQSGSAWRAQVWTQLQLEDARAEAEAAAAAKGTFLATMSHELRTPLNGVLGISRLLGETRLDGEQIELVSTLRESGENLLRLINDILDVSKLEASRVELDPVPFAPRRLLDDTMRPLAAIAGDNVVRWSLHDVPDQLCADAHRIRQVLTNLVGNAMKFTSHGEIEITATMVHDGQGKPTHLRMDVCDTGIGIPADQLTKIFDAFSQADASIARKYGGTGLGLAICAGLTKHMNGEIGVESESGKGSRFWFTVAVTVPQSQDQVADHAAVPPAVSRKLQVLVVEDNNINQLIIRRLLERDGHVVTMADHGAQAITIASSGAFDVILLDLGLPDIAGLEVARRLRDDEVSTPIVALTGNAESPEHQGLRALGLRAWLTKPVDANLLRATLNDLPPPPEQLAIPDLRSAN